MVEVLCPGRDIVKAAFVGWIGASDEVVALLPGSDMVKAVVG